MKHKYHLITNITKPSPSKIAKFHHQWLLQVPSCNSVECALQRHVRCQSACGRFTVVEDKVTQGYGSMMQVPIEEAKCDLKGGSHPQSLRLKPIWNWDHYLYETLEDGWLFLLSLYQYVQDHPFRDTMTLVRSLRLSFGLHKRDLQKVLSKFSSPVMPSLPLPTPWHQGTSAP